MEGTSDVSALKMLNHELVKKWIAFMEPISLDGKTK